MLNSNRRKRWVGEVLAMHTHTPCFAPNNTHPAHDHATPTPVSRFISSAERVAVAASS